VGDIAGTTVELVQRIRVMPTVLALTGGRGSGKTSVTNLLARRLNAKTISFGAYVRGEARRIGIEQTTENLQRIGQNLVSAEPTKFAGDVLRSAEWNGRESLIIDGIRHLVILEALRTLVSPSPLKLILLEVSAAIRKTRLMLRGDDVTNFEELDRAPTEVQIFAQLPARADLLIDGNLPLDEISDEIIRALAL
jgi:dephospho-CoA kinase